MFRSLESGPLLFSNSPETIVDMSSPVLAGDGMPGNQRFLVACHHANGLGQHTTLRILLANETEQGVLATVHRYVQGYWLFQHLPNTGQGMAVPGREAATSWLAGDSIPEPIPNPFAIGPGEVRGMRLGTGTIGTRYLEGYPGSERGKEWRGVCAAMVEFETSGPVKVFVVAGTPNPDYDFGFLNDKSNWAERQEPHVRGKMQHYRMLTEYPSTSPVVITSPNHKSLRKRYRWLDAQNALWPTLLDAYNGEVLPFAGEWLVENTIRFSVDNQLPHGEGVGIVINGRGGVAGGGVLLSYNAPWSYAAPVASDCFNWNAEPPPEEPNLGLLLTPADGLLLPRAFVPVGQSTVEFKFILGSGSNAPMHFVAYPCNPCIADDTDPEDPPEPPP